MTKAQLQNLLVGDTVDIALDGDMLRVEIASIEDRRECWAAVRTVHGNKRMIEADEYVKDAGLDTHDEQGRRVRGADFARLRPPTNDEVLETVQNLETQLADRGSMYLIMVGDNNGVRALWRDGDGHRWVDDDCDIVVPKNANKNSHLCRGMIVGEDGKSTIKVDVRAAVPPAWDLAKS